MAAVVGMREAETRVRDVTGKVHIVLWGLGFRVQGLGVRGLAVGGLEFRVWGLGIRV